jgi:uncharacterized protein YbbC (DUF1343 family)
MVKLTYSMRFYLFFNLFFLTISCAFSQIEIQLYGSIITGAQQTERYLPKLKNKSVAVVTNASGVIGLKHLIDTLLMHKIKIKKIFGPEHGFRGTSDAGEKIKNGKDSKTNIPVISLYGSHKKPTPKDLKGIDIVLYDIQDVGVRFYTYISTMTYVMEACAENDKPLIILDRPNPNGFYIDGPIMTNDFNSFLGLHPVPIVYGMTCGEYANMVNGEAWLKNKRVCNLEVIPLKNYDRKKFVSNLPVKPSPNLPNDASILAYPSLGLFEGTIMSIGRGTDFPFQCVGSPYHEEKNFSFQFKPTSNSISKKPRYQDTICYGVDLKNCANDFLKSPRINLAYLIQFYNQLQKDKQLHFFELNFNYHTGNETLQKQIISHESEEEIIGSWQADLKKFNLIRKKYLIYPDFQ